MDTSEVALVRAALAPVCGPLHAAVAKSSELAITYFSEQGMTGQEYRTCQSHLARAHLGQLLEASCRKGDVGAWRATLGKNCQVILESGGMHLRLLRPLQGLIVPPAGSNEARRAYYSQRLSQVGLLGAVGSDLIGIWSYDPTTLTSVIRIVRPVRPWPIQAGEKVDLDFLLPPSAQALTSLQFIPNDVGMDDLPIFENEEADGIEGLGG